MVLSGSFRENRTLRRLAPAAALLLLSLLWSFGTLRGELLPSFASGLPHLQRQALIFALFAVVAAVNASIQGLQPLQGKQIQTAILIGLGLFVAPAALLYLASGSVSGYTQAALFTLVPLFAIVLEPYIGSPSALSVSRNGMLAALAGCAGALFVFPIRFPASWPAAVGFCAVLLAAACVAAANCFAVQAARESFPKQLSSMAAIAGGTAALSFGVGTLWLETPVWRWEVFGPELLWSAAVELPALGLLFLLMRHLLASRMAARYVATPLLSVLIGALAMRMPLGSRIGLGVVLMAASAAYLIFAPAAEEDAKALTLHR